VDGYLPVDKLYILPCIACNKNFLSQGSAIIIFLESGYEIRGPAPLKFKGKLMKCGLSTAMIVCCTF